MTFFDEITSENKDKVLNNTPSWVDDGVYVVKPFEYPLVKDCYAFEKAINSYKEERQKSLRHSVAYLSGWSDPCTYLRVDSMKELCLHQSIIQVITQLIGGFEPALHLCLSGYRSTERAWHQDRYLNPETVGEYYVAVWIALDDIHPDSGPFQYVPGSHKWRVIERQKVLSHMKKFGQSVDDETWPTDSQGWVGDACEAEIKRRGAEIVSYLPKKGDVLFWHPSLLHRGSKPNNPNLERHSLIAHYSSHAHRPDMMDIRTHTNGAKYAYFERYSK